MSTEIEITVGIFKCQSDQEIFYQRLSEVTGIAKIVHSENRVQIWVNDKQSPQAFKDVSALCDIWHLSFRIIS
ncbi:hypothetical protein SAMN05216262_11358 [Colwellia chukchiensis]|uniref:HMA domain-containing protein n=1 Tax=Colwellia chukchiensis TaxID=641665 RepID=A0A1H7R2K5_9GAMM|nr:hypothetical protein [Colwellia chukchiensis]SEL54480.1 hypothetical protein SAMN05216262_11358 [Colwellia chukchiensis]